MRIIIEENLTDYDTDTRHTYSCAKGTRLSPPEYEVFKLSMLLIRSRLEFVEAKMVKGKVIM